MYHNAAPAINMQNERAPDHMDKGKKARDNKIDAGNKSTAKKATMGSISSQDCPEHRILFLQKGRNQMRKDQAVHEKRRKQNKKSFLFSASRDGRRRPGVREGVR